jgi:hypothetical protein
MADQQSLLETAQLMASDAMPCHATEWHSNMTPASQQHDASSQQYDASSQQYDASFTAI